jgi:hypothetical protein
MGGRHTSRHRADFPSVTSSNVKVLPIADQLPACQATATPALALLDSILAILWRLTHP